MNNKRINVTKSALPPLYEFIPYLEDIWQSRNLTNNAKYHQQLEKEIVDVLGVKYVSLFANGTLALVTALQVLRITGEVITTPYSFIATTHALHWNGIKPVFCDIDPDSLNLDPEKIEAAITPRTTAILPVHIYGNPCDVGKIEYIAEVYGLKVIYDACHAFGVKLNSNSILNFGDLSVLSFHATKAFTTFEGGAIICHDDKIKKRIGYLKNFGFADEITVVAPGINAKMNEFQAALGLLQLKYIEENIKKRQEIANFYRKELNNVVGIKVLNDIDNVEHNYSSFPILVDKEKYGMCRDELYNQLKEHGIYARRYFYPLISQFPTYRGLESAQPGKMPIAEKVTEMIICLPIYPDLSFQSVESIINHIKMR